MGSISEWPINERKGSFPTCSLYCLCFPVIKVHTCVLQPLGSHSEMSQVMCDVPIQPNAVGYWRLGTGLREKKKLRISKNAHKLCGCYVLMITVTHLQCPCALLGRRSSDGIMVTRVPGVEIVHDPEYNHVTLSLHDHHQVHLTTWIMFSALQILISATNCQSEVTLLVDCDELKHLYDRCKVLL